jgi:hypothetical protein
LKEKINDKASVSPRAKVVKQSGKGENTENRESAHENVFQWAFSKVNGCVLNVGKRNTCGDNVDGKENKEKEGKVVGGTAWD